LLPPGMPECAVAPGTPTFYFNECNNSDSETQWCKRLDTRPELRRSDGIFIRAWLNHSCRVANPEAAGLYITGLFCSHADGEMLMQLPPRPVERPYLIYFEGHFQPQSAVITRHDFLFFGFDLRDYDLSMYEDYDRSVPLLPGVQLPPPKFYQGRPPDPHIAAKYFVGFRGNEHVGIGKNGSVVRRTMSKAFSGYHRTRPDVEVVVMNDHYHPADNRPSFHELLNSSYMLIPGGHGRWSYRVNEAIGACAIPVFLSDGWGPPLRELIFWDKISITYPEAELTPNRAGADKLVNSLPRDQVEINNKRAMLCQVADRYFSTWDKRITGVLRAAAHRLHPADDGHRAGRVGHHAAAVGARAAARGQRGDGGGQRVWGGADGRGAARGGGGRGAGH
jgi:hypothetical protein